MSSIHGHDVLEMMINSGQSYTKSSLISAIQQKFGPAARFHTCSNRNMTAEELVGFLESKGKFIASDSGFTTNKNKICQH